MNGKIFKMSWEAFTSEIKGLGKRINYTPDCIVGIARGGVVPAVLLSKQLNIIDMYVLKVRVEGTKRTIIAEVFTDISKKNVLLVEDMLESGKSMIVVKDYLESKGAEVKTACLYIMPQTKIKPDFYLKVITKKVTFPWE